jgi:hypothetical protein
MGGLALTCDISGGIGLIIGSHRTLTCAFRPSIPGPIEFYAGNLTKHGIDIGVTAGGVMVWAVYAPTNQPLGALAGRYAGAGAEATFVAGVGTNVLIGGSNQTIELQPVWLQGQAGLNVAAGVVRIELRWVRWGALATAETGHQAACAGQAAQPQLDGPQDAGRGRQGSHAQATERPSS